MPRGDKTGPRGEGPMTGGGFGVCNLEDKPTEKNFFGFFRRGLGRGLGRGRGQNLCFGWRFWQEKISKKGE